MREMSGLATDELRSVPQIVLTGLAAGLFLGFAGPFGTYEELYLGWRLVYWVSLMLCGTLFFPIAYIVTRHTLAPRGVSSWIYVPLVAVVGAIPMTAMVIGITWAMFQTGMTFEFDNYLRVFGISLPMVGLQHLITELKQPAKMPASVPQIPVAPSLVQAAAPAPKRVKLLERLPGRLGEDILCLQMEDHYVRVHTALGNELLLMRLRDAMNELDGLEGLQVHRSWWVARSSISSWSRESKSLTLDLKNQLQVPVARDRVSLVKEAGWLS
jgi:LytTr DNA-binding domain